jgi:hypothetical protein
MATSTKGDAVKPDSVKVDVVSEGTPKRSTINKKLLLVVLSITLLLGAGLGVVFYCRFAGSCRDGGKSPPPPSPPTIDYLAMPKVTTTFEAAGDVADYDDTAKDKIKTVFATEVGVSVDAVTVTVTPASVSITVEVAVADAAAATAASSALSAGILAAPNALSTALSLSIESITAAPTVVLVSPSPPPPVPPSMPTAGASFIPPFADVVEGCAHASTTCLLTPSLTPPATNLIGAWTTNFGADMTVTSTKLYSKASYGTSSYNIEAWGDGWILAQNAATNTYNPGKWSLFQYHTSGSDYGYCQTIYDGESAIAVLSADTSTLYDSSDATTGCGSFNSPHTILTAFSSPLIGAWTSNYGTDMTVTSTKWYSKSSYGTSSYNIEAIGVGWILAQNAATNTYNPSEWSLFQYHTSGSDYGYCQTIYNGASATAALSADTSTLYDSADATTGCGSFNSPHTILTTA